MMENQSDPIQQTPAMARETTLCPVTQLPLLRKRDWEDIEVGPDLRLAFRVIGENILLCRVSGYASREGTEKGLNVKARIAAEAFPDKRLHLVLMDLTHMKGASADARWYFIKTLKEAKDKRVAGLVFFGASAFMRVSIKIGIRMNSRHNLRLAKDYGEAVRTAQKSLLSLHGRFDIPTRSKWEIQADNFSARYELLNTEVLHVSCTGYLEESHIESLVKMREQLTRDISADREHFSVIMDITGMTGSTLKARSLLFRQNRTYYVSRRKPLFLIYGARPILKTTISLAKALLPIRIVLVKDLESALSIIHQEQSSQTGSEEKVESIERQDDRPQDPQIRNYVEELLDYLGNINWEGSGLSDQNLIIGASHPFKPVFDAIALIKTEIDLLFQERKTADDDLRESEEKFKSLSQNAPDIIYTLDTNSELTYVNPAWEHILGYRRKEVVGRHLWDFADDENRELIRTLLKGRTEIIRDGSVVLLHKKGSPCTFNMSCAPNFNSTGQLIGMVGLLKDITEHRRLEAQFQQAQKMEAIGTLAGGIAHDFNNLLMGIQGYVSLLLFKKAPGDPDFEKLKNIELQIQRGADLTRQVLGFARAGKYQVKPSSLNELVGKSADMFGRTKKEIKIYQKFQSDLWTVEIDQGQIEQVLLNIFINAWQAMPAGGDLYLSTQNITLDGNYTTTFEIKPGNYVKLSITDTGVGMDEKVRKRIFEPFFTTKEMGRGTGLGLASAYGIVKGHGGIINVYSEKGHGSTFTIYLPATDSAAIEENGRPEAVLKGSETILLIDDEEMVLNVSREILQALGYKVIASKNGREAVDMYRSRVNEIDLVVVDMIMPDMSGLEVFKELKSINPGIIVILSSGYSINGAAAKIMEQGCNGFIQKPFDLQQISHKIREVLDQR